MFTELLELTIGTDRARDLMKVLHVDSRLQGPEGANVPPHVISMALHFLLFEELLNRSPTALAVAGEALQMGEALVIDHAALATLDVPYVGKLARGRHHLGQILEPLGFIQAEAHSLPNLNATAHIYRAKMAPDLVPDFVVMEIHGQRFDTAYEGAARNVFGETPSPNHVRVQSYLHRLNAGTDLTLDQAVEFLRGIFVWFGRQHVPPTKDDYAALAKANPISAWMAHEGQGLSHISLRVSHLSVAMDMQLRQGRELQAVKTSLDQSTRLAGLVPDVGLRPFRDSTNRIIEMDVPIANVAFIERAAEAQGARFEPGLF